MSLIGLILFLVLLGVLFWAVQQLPMVAEYKQAIHALAVVVLVVVIVYVLLVLLGGSTLHVPFVVR